MFWNSFSHPLDCEETVNIIADGDTRDDELRERKNVMQFVLTEFTQGKFSSQLKEEKRRKERKTLRQGEAKSRWGSTDSRESLTLRIIIKY